MLGGCKTIPEFLRPIFFSHLMLDIIHDYITSELRYGGSRRPYIIEVVPTSIVTERERETRKLAHAEELKFL